MSNAIAAMVRCSRLVVPGAGFIPIIHKREWQSKARKEDSENQVAPP
jgi:hypothetical protein